jgi:hypothetical protein
MIGAKSPMFGDLENAFLVQKLSILLARPALPDRARVNRAANTSRPFGL